MRIADRVHAEDLGDHLLVANCARDSMALLNPSAAMAWKCLARGLGVPEAADTIASAFSVSNSEAQRDVAALADGWLRAGWLQPGCAAVAGGPADLDDDGPDEGPLAGAPVHSGEYRLNGKLFRLDFHELPGLDAQGRRDLARVVALLAGLACGAHGGAGHRAMPISYAAGPRGVSIVRGGKYRFAPTAQEALSCLLMEIAEGAYAPDAWLCAMHAASVAWNGSGIALPAAAGSGKSTLAAHLAANGWDYLGDDLAMIDPAGNGIRPLPVSIGVKKDSVRVLRPAYPGLPALTEVAYGGGKAARYLTIGNAPDDGGRPLAALVFPIYTAQATAALERIQPAAAALLAMQAGVGFSRPLAPAMVGWFAALCRSIPCYALRYADLREADTFLRSVA